MWSTESSGWRTVEESRRGRSPRVIQPGDIADQASVRRVVVGSIPQGLDGADGGVWGPVGGAAIAHRGGTLKMVSLRCPGSLDPT